MKVVLLVSDVRRSRRFYTDLGFRVVERHADGVVVALGENVLELRSDAAAVSGPQYFTPDIDHFPRGTGIELAIDVADIDAAHAAARDADADVVLPLALEARGVRSFALADPDGYFVVVRAAARAATAGQ